MAACTDNGLVHLVCAWARGVALAADAGLQRVVGDWRLAGAEMLIHMKAIEPLEDEGSAGLPVSVVCDGLECGLLWFFDEVEACWFRQRG